MSGHASVRRILKAAGLLLTIAAALLVGVGAIWEQVERQRAVRDFPAPGSLVDIGSRRIQIDCRGTGSPTVVFESGLDIYGSLSSTKVQGEVAKFTRACAYSRAGIVWSDDKDGPHDGVRRGARSPCDARRGQRERSFRAGRTFARRSIHYRLYEALWG